MFLYDIYQNKSEIEDFTIFNLDDVDNSFEKIHLLKYSQNIL